jgi:DNA-binding IclR family transcriptional regulator
LSLLSQAQCQNFIFVLALAEFTENTLTQADQLLEATAEVRQKNLVLVMKSLSKAWLVLPFP